MEKGQVLPRMDEFAFVLLAGLVLIIVLMIGWTTPQEPAPWVEPDSVELSLVKGGSTSFELNITGTMTNVSLTAKGKIASWLSFSKNDFNVFRSTIVTIKVKVPRTANEGLYTGQIVVESTGGQKTVSVNIEVLETGAEVAYSSIALEDFSVSYLVASETLDSKEKVEIAKGLFTDMEVTLVGSLEEEKIPSISDAYVELIVEKTNQVGNLIVLLNEDEIFNKKVSTGKVTIPINKSKIIETNIISIRGGSPGLMFWANNFYRLRSVQFIVKYEEISPHEVTFSLKKDEVNNFDYFHLSFMVTDHSTQLPELLIKINNQLVYYKTPPMTFFNKTFEEDILGNNLILHEGNNTISFSFEKNAFYDISSAVLRVFYFA